MDTSPAAFGLMPADDVAWPSQLGAAVMEDILIVGFFLRSRSRPAESMRTRTSQSPIDSNL
jgi:hypothetical protein